MGYSSDGMPHVGEVPGKEGQYVCAGFSGHGMPQIFLSAKAVARIALKGSIAEDAEDAEGLDLPRLYKTSKARLESPRDVTLEAWEATNKESALKSKL